MSSNNIRLFEEGKSWLDYAFHVPTCDYGKLWSLKPEKKDKISLMGKEVELPRFQLMFGRVYKYNTLIEEEVRESISSVPFLEELRIFCEKNAKENYGLDINYDMVLVNFYYDGTSYIGPHSDKLTGIRKDAPIYSFTYCEENGERDFKIHTISGKSEKEYDCVLKNNTCVIMGGDMQKTHKHSVPVRKKVKGSRINITIRASDK
jgi:alkylated DNA repair dioxygenase AlkB